MSSYFTISSSINYFLAIPKPVFSTGPHSFKVVLPMLDIQAVNSGVKPSLSSTAQAVLDALDSSDGLTRETLQTVIGLSSSSVVKALNELKANELITCERMGRKFVYRINGLSRTPFRARGSGFGPPAPLRCRLKPHFRHLKSA